ncbi:cation efflux protein, CzcI family [Cupriavidus basilensis]|uniref:cation efflux protein, CzcI family n=1 Tax=Cupriavidus basilensis TaxID=68895 RepID=UPI0012E09588
MRRFALIFVLLILPFQFSWAAAARYCQHEKAAAVWHLGHHEHRHQQPEGKADVEKKSVVDTDCGVCHLASLQFVHGQAQGMPTAKRVEVTNCQHGFAFTSLNAREPDRPQWQRLA